MSETITCPSGLSGRIRGMKAREERVLADRKLARSGAQLEQIPAACWEETIDAGPYDFGELALALESGLAPVQGRLAGLAALRVRSARAAAAAALGDRERAEIGAVTAWTLVGPFGALHALEIDRRFAPEEGTLPESTAAPAGLPPVPARAIPCPDGTVPGRRASQRRHLLPGCRGPPGTRRGVPPHRRRYDHPASVRGRCAGGRAARLRRLPTAGAGGLHHARTGRHRLLLKIGRGEARALLGVSLARADDGAADATFAPAAAALPGAAVHRRATPPARAARERALLLDGADLTLRRALSLEDGKEPLDDVDENGSKAIAAYRAARRGHATSSVTVLDFGAVLREDVPPLLSEPDAPGDAEHLPFVQVGAGARRDALARAMADSLLEAFRPTREVLALAAEIARGAGSSRPPGGGGRVEGALARAAYLKVNELVLGQSGPFGEPASAIRPRGRGSRAVLLKSLLDVLGVKARVAVVRDFTRDPAPYRFPRPDLYGYAVLRVEEGGRVFWLDPTTRGTPFGVLPGPIRSVEALVLPGPGAAVEVARTPAGDTGFRSPALTDLRFDGEDAVEGPLVLRWRARVERWARLEEGRAIVEAPVFPARLAARFLQRASRETSLLVADDERTTLELTVSPPPGFTPVPARAADVASAFGRYRRSERVEAGRLAREDQYDLLRGRVAPADYPAFAGFASAVDAAQEEPIAFQRSNPG